MTTTVRNLKAGTERAISGRGRRTSMEEKVDARTDARTEGHAEDVPRVSEVARRLVVELNSKSVEDLTWLVSVEETNKTTIVNRALQVYKMIMELQQRDGSIIIDDPARDAPERLRIV